MLTTLSYSYSHFPPRQTEVSMTRKIQNIFQFQAGNNRTGTNFQMTALHKIYSVLFNKRETVEKHRLNNTLF